MKMKLQTINILLMSLFINVYAQAGQGEEFQKPKSEFIKISELRKNIHMLSQQLEEYKKLSIKILESGDSTTLIQRLIDSEKARDNRANYIEMYQSTQKQICIELQNIAKQQAVLSKEIQKTAAQVAIYQD